MISTALAVLMFISSSNAGLECHKTIIEKAKTQIERAKAQKCLPASMRTLDAAIRELQSERTCNQAHVTRIKRAFTDARIQTLLKDGDHSCEKHLDEALESLQKL